MTRRASGPTSISPESPDTSTDSFLNGILPLLEGADLEQLDVLDNWQDGNVTNGTGADSVSASDNGMMTPRGHNQSATRRNEHAQTSRSKSVEQSLSYGDARKHDSERQCATTAEEQLTLMRQRNRQAQARCRQKLKEKERLLTSQLSNLQAQMVEQLACSKKARKQHAAMQERVSAAQAGLSALHSRVHTMRASPTPAHGPPPRQAHPSAYQSATALAADVPSHGSLHPSSKNDKPNGGAVISARSLDRPSLFRPRRNATSHPSTFAAHAPITWSQVAVHATAHCAAPDPAAAAVSLSGCSLNAASVGWVLRDYKDATAARMGRTPRDVCWYARGMYCVAPHAPLTPSTHLGSHSCMLTMVANALLRNGETLFLTAQRGHLDDASEPMPLDSAVLDSVGECGAAASGVSCRLTPPPRPLLRQAGHEERGHLRCGMSLTVPMHDAMPVLVHGMLSRYAASLPCDVWLDCAKSCRTLLKGVFTVSYLTPEKRVGSGTGDADGVRKRCLHAKADGPDIVAALEHDVLQLASIYAECLDAHMAEVKAWQAAHPRREPRYHARCSASHECSVQQQRYADRMQCICREYNFLRLIISSDAPVLMRRLLLCIVYPRTVSTSQVYLQQLDIYSQLRFSPSQKVELGNIWTTWLTGHERLASAQMEPHRSLSSLPTPEAIPSGWLAHINAWAQHRPLSATPPAPPGAELEGTQARTGPCTHHGSCLHCGPGLEWAARVQGACAHSLDTAARSVAQLYSLHDSCSQLYVHIMSMLYLHEGAMASEQHILFWAEQVRRSAIMGDYLHVVSLAAQENRSERVFRAFTPAF